MRWADSEHAHLLWWLHWSTSIPFSLLLGNNKSLHNLHPVIELFFFCSLHFISTLVTHVKCCPRRSVFTDCLSVWSSTQWLTINLIAGSSERRVSDVEHPVRSLSLLVFMSMSLSKSSRWSSVSCSFLATDVSQSAADLRDSVPLCSLRLQTGVDRNLTHSLPLALL